MRKRTLIIGIVVLVYSCASPDLGTNWSQGPDLPFPLANFATAGRYLIGGDSTSIDYLNTNLYFDGTAYVSRAPLEIDGIPIPLKNACAAFDGSNVFVFGGYAAGPTSFAFTYNPGTDLWRDIGPMPYSTYGCSAAYTGGEIHIMGGNGQTDHYVYIPSSDTFVSEPPSLYTHDYGCAVATGTSIYLIGGENDLVEEYDIVSNTWSEKARLGLWLKGHACAVYDGLIYVFGGEMENGEINTQVFRYDPAADRWEAVSEIPTPRKFLGAFVYGNTIHVVGGIDDNGSRTRVDEIFVPQSPIQ